MTTSQNPSGAPAESAAPQSPRHSVPPQPGAVPQQRQVPFGGAPYGNRPAGAPWAGGQNGPWAGGPSTPAPGMPVAGAPQPGYGPGHAPAGYPQSGYGSPQPAYAPGDPQAGYAGAGAPQSGAARSGAPMTYPGVPQQPAGMPPAGTGSAAWPNASGRAAAAPSAPRNGFGTTALVLGILGLLFSLIPFVGVIAWPLVILGLIFGALGIVRASKGRATNRGVAIAGTVLSALGLIMCFVYTAAFAQGVSDGMSAAGATAPVAPTVPAVSAPVASAPTASAPAVTEPADDRAGAAATAPAGGDVITYEVSGSGTAGTVTYVKDENLGQEQANGVDLPWRKDVTFDGGPLSFQPLSLVAQSGSGGNGEITCRILRDGKELTSSSSSGPYAVVTCSAS